MNRFQRRSQGAHKDKDRLEGIIETTDVMLTTFEARLTEVEESIKEFEKWMEEKESTFIRNGESMLTLHTRIGALEADLKTRQGYDVGCEQTMEMDITAGPGDE